MLFDFDGHKKVQNFLQNLTNLSAKRTSTIPGKSTRVKLVNWGENIRQIEFHLFSPFPLKLLH